MPECLSVYMNCGIVTLSWSMRGEEDYLNSKRFDLTEYTDNYGNAIKLVSCQ